MRVAFLGNAAWSVPPLEALAASRHEVAVVVTRAPKPGGRGNRLIPTPVAEAARELNLPLEEVVTVKRDQGLEALRAVEPDVLVVVAYGEILPKEVLEIPTIAPVNLHFSLLPELRGAAPVQRALMEGLTATGVTTMRMDEGMDTGPILLQAEEAIEPTDDAGSLGMRLAGIGGRLLIDTLDRLAAGELKGRPQDDAEATFAPKLRPEERVIDWTQSATQIVNQVRALSPAPGASATFRGKNLKVMRATADTEAPSTAPAGTIAIVSKEGLAVATSEGLVRLEEVALEGRRRMSGAEFVRGHRPDVGEPLA